MIFGSLITFVDFSEVRVGELDLESEKDCVRTFCAASPQTFNVEKVIKHEKWDLTAFKNGYDVALVRIKGSIKFFLVRLFYIFNTILVKLFTMIHFRIQRIFWCPLFVYPGLHRIWKQMNKQRVLFLDGAEQHLTNWLLMK